MSRVVAVLFAGALVVSLAATAFAHQQPDPNSPRYKGVVALEELLSSVGDGPIDTFIDNRIASSVLDSMERAALVEALKGLRDEAAEGEMRGAAPISPLAAEIMFDMDDGASFSIEFELDEADTDRFAFIRSPGYTIGG